MKKQYALVLFMAVLSVAVFYSCKKDTSNIPSKTPEEILTANSWQISKIRSLQNGTAYYYQRGTSNHDLDNEYITFKSDHTGTYTAPTGVQSAVSSWNFVDAEKTQIQYTIMFSPALLVNWENVALTSSGIKYGEYHMLNGINSLAIATRVPK